MNKKLAQEINIQINGAISKVLTENSLTMLKSNGRFGEDTLKLTMEFKEMQKGEKPLEALKRDFDRIAILYGLQKEHYGKIFMFNGTKFCVVGISPKSRKYPIRCEQLKTGKVFKFTAESVIHNISMYKIV